MSTPTQAIWNLTIHDQSGTTVATAHQAPNGAPNFHGDMIALAEALPGVTSLSRFLIDPDEQARACYEAYSEACAHTYGETRPTWDQLKAQMPLSSHIIKVWQKTAAAALAVDPALN